MRKSLVACVAFVLVLAGGLLALVGPRHCPVNRAAYERVKEGMTQLEVHAAIGLPPGDYRTRPPDPTYLQIFDWSPGVVENERHWERWEGDRGTVIVSYSDENRVAVSAVGFAESTRPGLLERISSWVRNRLSWAG